MTKDLFIELQSQQYKSGKTLQSFLQELGIAYSTWYYWRKKYVELDKSNKLAPISVTRNNQESVQVRKFQEVSTGIRIAGNLLYNKEFIKLVEENCYLLYRLDNLLENISEDCVRKCIVYVKKQLVNGLVNSGATPIEDEKVFSLLRHETSDDFIAKNGDIIADTIEPGVVVEDRVFRKAKVYIERKTL